MSSDSTSGGSRAALAIVLDAPLQAWGVDSRYQRRETSAFPTKSGLLGLLAAALGIDKHAPGEAEALAPFAALRCTVVRNALDRAATAGRLSDFHTIGGGFDSSDPLSAPRKASGGSFGTVITRRVYLTDSAFIALFEGARAVLERAAAALENPVWGVWLGRKACVPATPLAPTLRDTPREAFDALRARFNLPPRPLEEFDRQTEPPPDAGFPDVFFQPDQPLGFGSRAFQARPARYLRKGETRAF